MFVQAEETMRRFFMRHLVSHFELAGVVWR
jgi:hypothetical protein